MFRVFYENGQEVQKGDVLYSKGEPWIYDGCTHPRKIYVYWDEDPKGEPFYPNRSSREYYANVFDLGIWGETNKEWTFEPRNPFTPNL